MNCPIAFDNHVKRLIEYALYLYLTDQIMFTYVGTYNSRNDIWCIETTEQRIDCFTMKNYNTELYLNFGKLLSVQSQ